MFPAIMVDIETPIPIEGPCVVGTYDFEGVLPHEISFGEGEELGLLGYIDEAWARAWYRGKEGAIPLDFVEVVEDLPGERVLEGWPEEWIPEVDPAEHPEGAEEVEEDLPADLVAASEQAAAAAIAAGRGADSSEAFEPKSGIEPSQPMPLPKPKPRAPKPTPAPKAKPQPQTETTAAAASQPAPAKVKTPRMAEMSSEIATARVLHTYEASAPDEMTIVEGQMVRQR